jgi:ATP-dependent protease HslVU (ClpYQ) peptidase subunit
LTCIVGVVGASNLVWLAADSLGSGGGLKQEFSTPKLISLRAEIKKDHVFQRTESIIIGYTGSFRVGNVLHKQLKIPSVSKELYEYMVCDFVPEVMDKLDHAGCLKDDHHIKSGQDFLVGISGRLFAVQSDFSVLEPAVGYTAIGSGQEFALGALHALETTDYNAKQVAQLAVAAASAFSTTVGGTIHVIST